jgi:potassium efflux system protein
MVREMLYGKDRWKLFGKLFLLVTLISIAFSVLIRFILFTEDQTNQPKLALVAPLQTPAGQSLLRGATLYVEQINRQGGYQGRPIKLMSFEEGDHTAQQISRETNILGVLGHLDPGLLQASASTYQAAKLRVVTTLPIEGIEGVYSLGIKAEDEARFLANYARNILQRRLLYVIREESSEFETAVAPVLEIYGKFDTPVREVWTLPPQPTAEQLDALLGKIRDIDIGSLYIATNPELAALLVQRIRSAGSMLSIFGPSVFASNGFTQPLAEKSLADAEIHAHGIYTVSPFLFDTANESAQRFQSSYQSRFKESPDWIAALAFDAGRYFVSGMPPEQMDAGLLGRVSFSGQRAVLPIQIGLYNGTRLISAPIQLLPMVRGASFNYIEALRQGRVIYVNDRFMYRSNVVYTGITVHEVSDVDLKKEVATLDLSIWFRYRGKFEPNEIDIANAKEPVKFGEPVEASADQDFQYRKYRIKQSFQLNFADTDRGYGQHVAGISFRHRTLNNNNLIYVVDVLGMPTGEKLIEDLTARKVVAADASLRIDNAWIAQSTVRERSNGAPQYVSMTGDQPNFSTLTLGLLLTPEGVTARDLFSLEQFVYLGVFGLVGAVAALVIDRRRRTRQMQFQSWLLRVVFWPCLLISIGNLAIYFSFVELSTDSNRLVVAIYDSLWWIMGARLVDIAVRRFLWIPLEERSGRNIPNVVKFISGLVIYSLGFAGITAIVLEEPLTSLLATSGLLAMVIGLAIQANIANVFSGIVLNLERPFQVGDYISVNDIVGRVTDITWRTTRIESNDGPSISLANAMISEAQLANLSQLPHGYIAETDVFVNPDCDVDLILQILNEAVAQSDAIVLKEDPVYGPRVRFLGVVSTEYGLIARFNARYRVINLPKRDLASDQIWRMVVGRFKELGIISELSSS